eukprot:SAG11_NODE_5131_length_1656_cov_1.095697_1_plen_52_part_10
MGVCTANFLFLSGFIHALKLARHLSVRMWLVAGEGDIRHAMACFTRNYSNIA